MTATGQMLRHEIKNYSISFSCLYLFISFENGASAILTEMLVLALMRHNCLIKVSLPEQTGQEGKWPAFV